MYATLQSGGEREIEQREGYYCWGIYFPNLSFCYFLLALFTTLKPYPQRLPKSISWTEKVWLCGRHNATEMWLLLFLGSWRSSAPKQMSFMLIPCACACKCVCACACACVCVCVRAQVCVHASVSAWEIWLELQGMENIVCIVWQPGHSCPLGGASKDPTADN